MYNHLNNSCYTKKRIQNVFRRVTETLLTLVPWFRHSAGGSLKADSALETQAWAVAWVRVTEKVPWWADVPQP